MIYSRLKENGLKFKFILNRMIKGSDEDEILFIEWCNLALNNMDNMESIHHFISKLKNNAKTLNINSNEDVIKFTEYVYNIAHEDYIKQIKKAIYILKKFENYLDKDSIHEFNLFEFFLLDLKTINGEEKFIYDFIQTVDFINNNLKSTMVHLKNKIVPVPIDLNFNDFNILFSDNQKVLFEENQYFETLIVLIRILTKISILKFGNENIYSYIERIDEQLESFLSELYEIPLRLEQYLDENYNETDKLKKLIENDL